MLDGASKVPLYHQLAEDLFRAIRAGSYKPGDRIPSEHELAERFGVGRPTVRQATDSLIQRGVLVRKRGSGTFVRSVPAQVDLFSLAGTLVSFEARGIALKSELLGRARTEIVAGDDAHPFSGERAVRVVRLSSVSGEPVLLEAIDFLATRFAGLERLSLKGRSLSEVVEQRYAMRAVSADQTFRVELLDRALAARFSVPVRTPVLRVDRTLCFSLVGAAVFARMYCRTDRFVFSQRIGGHSHA